jgi:hypothetical protein
MCGGVAQSVEQAAHNRCVAGSSPATATALGAPYSRTARVGSVRIFLGGPTPPRPRPGEFPRTPWGWYFWTLGLALEEVLLWLLLTCVRRSRWRARSASTATTSPRRTGVTTRIAWRSRNSVRTAVRTGRTRRLADLVGEVTSGRPGHPGTAFCAGLAGAPRFPVYSILGWRAAASVGPVDNFVGRRVFAAQGSGIPPFSILYDLGVGFDRVRVGCGQLRVVWITFGVVRPSVGGWKCSYPASGFGLVVG